MTLTEILRTHNPESHPDCHEAADLLERQQAEIERLREAGRVLATRVLQSDLTIDDAERAARDALLPNSEAQPPLEQTDKHPADASRGPEHCSPALTECPRCKNDWRLCDGDRQRPPNCKANRPSAEGDV